MCKGDPEVPEYHEKCAIAGFDRVTSHLDAPGKLKRARSAKENKQLGKKLVVIEAGYQHERESVTYQRSGTKLKKRRLGADQKLALSTVN